MTDVAAPRPSAVAGRRRRGVLLFGTVFAVAGIAAILMLDPPPIHILKLGLPGSIELCGRSYEGGDSRRWRLEDVRVDSGVEPVVVEPWLHQDCVPGACSQAAAGPCHTVIFARVGAHELAGYELQGGP